MKKRAKNLWKKTAFTVTAAAAAFTLYGCSASDDKAADAKKDSAGTEPTVVEVGVVGEYNEQWDTINELLAPENIQVELVKFTDYAAPNRALSDGEIDLNAFQTKTFLQNDMKQKGYDLTVIGDTIIAPLAIYNNKDKIQTIKDIKDGDIIAIPNDLTNGGRALKLLEKAGLIECDPAKGFVPTKADITKYNVKIELREAESATLANILPDCTAAIINGGNALTAGLNSVTDSIYTEDVNPDTNPQVPELINVIAARTEDKDNEIYKKVVEAYQSSEVEKTIKESYKGAFLCAWENAEEEQPETSDSAQTEEAETEGTEQAE